MCTQVAACTSTEAAARMSARPQRCTFLFVDCHPGHGHHHIPSTTHPHARPPMPTTSTIPNVCEVWANAHTQKNLHFQNSKHDSVSEWLRRWTRNPLGSARRGSNPLAVAGKR